MDWQDRVRRRRFHWHARVGLTVALLVSGAPVTAAPAPEDPPLAREDHTRILYVVYANAAQIRRRLEVQNPTGVDVLRAALRAEAVDTYTRARIEAVLRVLPEIELAQAKIPAAERTAVDEIASRLAASPTVTTKLLLLASLDVETQTDGRYARFSGVNSGLLTAGRLVSDGLTTVYSVDWVYTALADSPSRMLLRGTTPTEIGGGAAGDFAQVWGLTKSVLERAVLGAMWGAAGYYAARIRPASAAECATAKAIGDSVREIITRID
jgi:hypothetical protein